MSLDFLKETPEFKDLVRAVSSLPKTLEGQALLFGEQDRPRLSISGLTEAAVPYLFVQLALAGPRRVVFIRPSARPLSGFEDQARFFLQKLGSTKTVRSFPALSENPAPDAAPSLEAAATRMRYFYDLQNRPPVLFQ